MEDQFGNTVEILVEIHFCLKSWRDSSGEPQEKDWKELSRSCLKDVSRPSVVDPFEKNDLYKCHNRHSRAKSLNLNQFIIIYPSSSLNCVFCFNQFSFRSLILFTTWGREVQDQLRNVQHIQSSSGAFAAICDGRVITWGSALFGTSVWSKQIQGPLTFSDGVWMHIASQYMSRSL